MQLSVVEPSAGGEGHKTNEAAYRGFALIADQYAKTRWLRWSQGRWEAAVIVEISGIWHAGAVNCPCSLSSLYQTNLATAGHEMGKEEMSTQSQDECRDRAISESHPVDGSGL